MKTLSKAINVSPLILRAGILEIHSYLYRFMFGIDDR